VKAAEMFLTPNIVVFKKFKVPKFAKYTCTQYPITHMNKMTKVIRDEKLIIHFFQESLAGVALSWYMRLDNTKIKRLKDLMNAFVN